MSNFKNTKVNLNVSSGVMAAGHIKNRNEIKRERERGIVTSSSSDSNKAYPEIPSFMDKANKRQQAHIKVLNELDDFKLKCDLLAFILK
ncbi:hypothetical protein [Inconstantimicrobium porci]|uniref:Uncharacterized protein n=1 Tax=Inconstantimicrobium porci TaxID=2652291 RepID=A0A7X2N0W9_9CLOT|nr:hypothetical protein [Inconstantimicrobium porci]MSR92694.1 hypothetical protein [Inconstantimicrobium porci]